MKRFLLSSIIMLGVCGIASAQTGSKFNKKAQATTTSTVAPTPQKAAIMPTSDAAVGTPAIAEDINAASTSTKTKAAEATTGTSVNAAGVAVPNDDAARREAKLAAAKAANAPKPGKQN